MRGGASSPLLSLSGQAHLCPINRASSTVLLRWSRELTLLNVEAGEGWSQFCASLSWRPLVVTGAMYISTKHGCGSVMGAAMALSSAPGPDITWALVASRPPTSFRSLLFLPLQICLSPQDIKHSASLSPVHHHIFTYHNGAKPLGPWFLLPTHGRWP